METYKIRKEDRRCKYCKNFGTNLDANIENYCWSGLHKTNPESCCVIFEPGEQIPEEYKVKED